MSQFDPYLNWLGIPAHEQPPHFYRLLGIVLFESNPQVIEQAADRQSLAVGAHQAGPQGELCQRLLGEIAIAKHSLLDSQQKSGYDAYLQQILAHRGECSVAAPPPPTIIGAAAPPAVAPQYLQPPNYPAHFLPPMPPAQMPLPPMSHAPMPQPGMLLPPLPQPAPPAPMMSPQPMPVAASYLPVMSAARPAIVPVAAHFQVAARAGANGAVSTPAAPPAIPPAAPLRPMEELERLAAQPSGRRRFVKRKKVEYSKEIVIGGIAAAVAVVLVIIYLAAQGIHATGFGAIGDEGRNSPHPPRSQKWPVEKAMPEKKTAAAVSAPLNEGGLRKPPEAAAPLRTRPAASVEGNTGSIPAAWPATAPRKRQDIASPHELGGPDDPVMGPPDER
jgi:hypothetical protein